MKEDYLHYIWSFGLFDKSDLKTVNGERILILDKGVHNSNAGPDFLNAQIKIGDTIWAGNVEIHIKASDWINHKHHKDHAYNTVILHVVLFNDKAVCNAEGIELDCLSLSTRLKWTHLNSYEKLITNREDISCKHRIMEVNTDTITAMKKRCIQNRFDRKSANLLKELERTKGNLEQLLYELLAANFGFKVNTEAFEQLAKKLELSFIRRFTDRPRSIEALIFGSAGFLNEEFNDDYPRELKEEFDFLRKKHQIECIKRSSWRFMRTRPSNFPSIRLAQFAALLNHTKALKNINYFKSGLHEWRKIFEFKVPEYWDNHLRFDRISKVKTKSIGESSVENIIINTLAQFMNLQGVYHQNPIFKQNATSMLRECRSEENMVIKKWQALNIPVKDAFDSQALLELYAQFCKQKRCLNCYIGQYQLNEENLQ